MRDRYDVIVVGAGPAGSTAARFAAQGGADVLLLEKDREVGVPVRCAEGVGERGLKSVVKIDPHWIANKITGVEFYSPSGKKVTVQSDDVGFVLDRKRFDYDLAIMAGNAGSDLRTKANVVDLLRDNGRVCGVCVELLGEIRRIRADIVIGADGVESRAGRWAGLKTRLAMKDMETCVQMTAGNIDVTEEFIHLFFGSQIAPGGYLWIFPKGGGVANIGLGISGKHSKDNNPLDFLDRFMKEKFPRAVVFTTVAGGVPCAPPMKQLVSDGFLLVGDAAHMSNPVSGGGIVNAMLAARIAGEVAAGAVRDGVFTQKRLAEYEKLWYKGEGGLWYKGEGGKHKRFYKLKEYVYEMTDEDLEKTADMLLELPIGKRTLVNIFKSALIKRPSLIIDAIKVFT
jgi:digeranylgeranylglycerophospholipid reductase